MQHKLKYYLYPERYSNVIYQITFILITATLLSIQLHKFVCGFHPVGNEPRVVALTAQPIAGFAQQPYRVQVGMHITDFLRFDTIKNEFIINAFIWFLFDGSKVPLKTLEQFSFTKGEIIHKSEPHITKQGALTSALYTIRLQFSTILDYARFPLDDHRIFLNLTNPNVSADQIIYEAAPNNYLLSQNIYISGWQVVGHKVTSGYAAVPLGDAPSLLQPKTIFSIDLSKGDLRQLSLIFLPLLFLFYLGLFAFSIADITIAMTLPLATVSGLLAYSFVIQTLAPAVGYMMISDYLFLFFLLSTFIILLIKALIALPEHILSKLTIRRIEGVTIVLLQIALIIVWHLLV
jgi:hypothetical protein